MKRSYKYITLWFLIILFSVSFFSACGIIEHINDRQNGIHDNGDGVQDGDQNGDGVQDGIQNGDGVQDDDQDDNGNGDPNGDGIQDGDPNGNGDDNGNGDQNGDVEQPPLGIIEYIVISGDSFWKISQQFGITVDALINANPHISNPSLIYIGQVIFIPTMGAIEEPPTSPPETQPPATPDEGKKNLSYLFAGTTVAYLKNVDNTKTSLNTVNPDYFDIDSLGRLYITPPNKIDINFINEMHRRGIKVIPFISNHWNRTLGEKALDNRQELSNQIAEVVEQYNLDGIDIDIENVNEKYREKYTDFTRLLREKLPQEKIVSVAVAANPKGWTLGWHGSYDYKALAKHADYLMIMTYDESYYGSPAGPVSSAKFFEDSIKYAINQGISKNKIVAGIPFFGRFWKQGDAIGGIGITANDVKFLIANYDSTTRYDAATQSANAIITIKETDPKPRTWGGRILTEGTYNIWYDDVQAVEYKLKTIADYGVKGVGSWALGQENLEIWNFFTSVLNEGATLPPASSSESQVNEPTTPNPVPVKKPKPDKPSKNKIKAFADSLEQKENKSINENEALTKGEFAVLIADMTFLTPEENEAGFIDTNNYWGKGQINALKKRGVIQGKGNRFNPEKKLTRAELAIILSRILELPDTIDFHTMPFKDVKINNEAYYEISKLYFYGILEGKSKDNFNPDDTVSLADFAYISDLIDYYDYPLNPDYILIQKARGNPVISPR